jgi:hypothetical protein
MEDNEAKRLKMKEMEDEYDLVKTLRSKGYSTKRCQELIARLREKKAGGKHSDVSDEELCQREEDYKAVMLSYMATQESEKKKEFIGLDIETIMNAEKGEEFKAEHNERQRRYYAKMSEDKKCNEKEFRNMTVDCPCEGQYTLRHRAKHLKTEKHRKWMGEQEKKPVTEVRYNRREGPEVIYTVGYNIEDEDDLDQDILDYGFYESTNILFPEPEQAEQIRDLNKLFTRRRNDINIHSVNFDISDLMNIFVHTFAVKNEMRCIEYAQIRFSNYSDYLIDKKRPGYIRDHGETEDMKAMEEYGIFTKMNNKQYIFLGLDGPRCALYYGKLTKMAKTNADHFHVKF